MKLLFCKASVGTNVALIKINVKGSHLHRRLSLQKFVILVLSQLAGITFWWVFLGQESHKYLCGSRYLKNQTLKALFRMQVWGVTQLPKYQHVAYSELFCDSLFVLIYFFRRFSMSPVSFLSSSGEYPWCPQVSHVAPVSCVHTIELQLLKPRYKSIGSVHTVPRDIYIYSSLKHLY